MIIIFGFVHSIHLLSKHFIVIKPSIFSLIMYYNKVLMSFKKHTLLQNTFNWEQNLVTTEAHNTNIFYNTNTAKNLIFLKLIKWINENSPVYICIPEWHPPSRRVAEMRYLHQIQAKLNHSTSFFFYVWHPYFIRAWSFGNCYPERMPFLSSLIFTLC